MNTVKSSKAKALLSNPDFTEVMADIRNEQIAVFVNSAKDDTIKREDAKVLLIALDKISATLQSRANDEKFIK